MNDTNEIDNIHDKCININQRIIYLHGAYETEEPGVDFRMFNTFIKNLDYLNGLSNDPVTIKMGTYGGSWNYGMAIFDCIKRSSSPIIIEAYSHSRSMSSIIPQAAATRLIARHADFMIHYGTDGTEGDYRAVVNYVKNQEKQTEVMRDIYASRCVKGPFFVREGMGISAIREFLREKINTHVDWWMSAEDAVDYGFMDGVIC